MSKTILVFTCEEQMEMGFVEIRVRQSFLEPILDQRPIVHTLNEQFKDYLP
jgi:hypothetical protein